MHISTHKVRQSGGTGRLSLHVRTLSSQPSSLSLSSPATLSSSCSESLVVTKIARGCSSDEAWGGSYAGTKRKTGLCCDAVLFLMGSSGVSVLGLTLPLLGFLAAPIFAVLLKAAWPDDTDCSSFLAAFFCRMRLSTLLCLLEACLGVAIVRCWGPSTQQPINS